MDRGRRKFGVAADNQRGVGKGSGKLFKPEVILPLAECWYATPPEKQHNASAVGLCSIRFRNGRSPLDTESTHHFEQALP